MNLAKNEREIRAPRGRALNAQSWSTEAPLRLFMNNLDPDVAERPQELVVVYGGIGHAGRNWECFDRIETLDKHILQIESRLNEITDRKNQIGQ